MKRGAQMKPRRTEIVLKNVNKKLEERSNGVQSIF